MRIKRDKQYWEKYASDMRPVRQKNWTVKPAGCECRCPGCTWNLDYSSWPKVHIPESDRIQPTKGSWHSMKNRVTNPNCDSYKYYGAIGVRICLWWERSFKWFYRDMGERPEGTTLDRINADGDYTPYNCRWANPGEQSKNRRNSIYRNPNKEYASANLDRLYHGFLLDMTGIAESREL